MGKPDKFRELLEQKRSEYKDYSPMFCPVLAQEVVFRSPGFNHLRFHVDGKKRKRKEQVYKLCLLPLVRPTIHLAREFSYQKQKEIEYWGLEAIVGRQKVKIRVILKRVNRGDIHFWSLMKPR